MVRTTRNGAPPNAAGGGGGGTGGGAVDALDNLNLDDMFADDGDALFDGLDIDLNGMEDVITGGNLEDKQKGTGGAATATATATGSAAVAKPKTTATTSKRATGPKTSKTSSARKTTSATSTTTTTTPTKASASSTTTAGRGGAGGASSGGRRKTKRKTVAPAFFDDQDDSYVDDDDDEPVRPVKKKAKRASSKVTKKKGSKKAGTMAASAAAAAAALETKGTSTATTSTTTKKGKKAGSAAAAARGSSTSAHISAAAAAALASTTTPKPSTVAASGQFGGRQNRKSGTSSVASGPKNLKVSSSRAIDLGPKGKAGQGAKAGTNTTSTASSKLGLQKQQQQAAAATGMQQQHPGLIQGDFCGLSPSATLFYPFMPSMPTEPALKNRKVYPVLDKIHTSFLQQITPTIDNKSSSDKSKMPPPVKESEPIYTLMKEAFKDDHSNKGSSSSHHSSSSSKDLDKSSNSNSAMGGTILNAAGMPVSANNNAAAMAAAERTKRETIGRGIAVMRRAIGGAGTGTNSSGSSSSSIMDKTKLAQDLLAVCALLKRQHDFLKVNHSNMERWCRNHLPPEEYASVYISPEMLLLAKQQQLQQLQQQQQLQQHALLYSNKPPSVLDTFVNPIIRVKLVCTGFKEPKDALLLAKLPPRPPNSTASMMAAAAAAAAAAARDETKKTTTSSKASQSKKRKLPGVVAEEDSSTKPLIKAGGRGVGPATAAAAAAAVPKVFVVPLPPPPKPVPPTYTTVNGTFRPVKRRKMVTELISKTAAGLEQRYEQRLQAPRRLQLEAQQRRMRETAEDKSVPVIHTVGMWKWLQEAGYLQNRIDDKELRLRLQQEEDYYVTLTGPYQAQLQARKQQQQQQQQGNSTPTLPLSHDLTGMADKPSTTQSTTMEAATILNRPKRAEGGVDSSSSSLTFLDRLQSLLVCEENDVREKIHSDDNDDDDSKDDVMSDEDDNISISSDEYDDGDDDSGNILTVNLSTLSMNERAFLHTRRAGLMTNVDVSTRTGLDVLLGSSLFSAAAAAAATGVKQPTKRATAQHSKNNEKRAIVPSSLSSTKSCNPVPKTTSSSNSSKDKGEEGMSKEPTATPTSSSSTVLKDAAQATASSTLNSKGKDGKSDTVASACSSTAKDADPNAQSTGHVKTGTGAAGKNDMGPVSVSASAVADAKATATATDTTMKEKPIVPATTSMNDKDNKNQIPHTAMKTDTTESAVGKEAMDKYHSTSSTINTGAEKDVKNDKSSVSGAVVGGDSSSLTATSVTASGQNKPMPISSEQAAIGATDKTTTEDALDQAKTAGNSSCHDIVSPKKKQKKKVYHLDDIIDSMTTDLMHVTDLNHRRGVFLQRTARHHLERPSEFIQRKEREAQAIASCQALLKRHKEAAAARAKAASSGGTASDDLALPW